MRQQTAVVGKRRCKLVAKLGSRFLKKKKIKTKKKYLEKTKKKGGGQKSLLGRQESEDKKWNVRVTNSV